MKQVSIFIFLIISFLCQLTAQKTTISNVQRSSFRSTDVIKQGAEVKGYYFFYVSDKIDKHTNEYTLRIMDNNLNQLKDVKFLDSKGVTVLESSFNGTDLIFLFYNEEDMTFDFQIFGADGNKKPFIYSRILSKKEKNYLTEIYQRLTDEESSFKGIFPVEEKGFISNTPSIDDGNYTFQINYYSSQKKKQWSFTPFDDYKRVVGDYLGYNNGVVYLEVLKYKSIMSGNPESSLIGLNLETGKMVFDKPTNGKFKFYPSTISVINGQTYLYGEYFKLDDNIIKDHSLGLAFWSIDEKGKVIAEKYNSWATDVAKYLNVSAKGKIDDFGYLYLHNMVQTAGGDIYAIGEGYRKVASAAGIVTKIIGGGEMSVAKFQVTNLALVQFDKEFNLKGIKIYEKNENNLELPNGFEFNSSALLGKYIKYATNGFDYRYIQSNMDNSTFSICYSDYERSKDYKGGTFKSISFNNGKFSEDKINTLSKASTSWVLPGKLGQVLLVDYYKKDKKIEAHFEKLN